METLHDDSARGKSARSTRIARDLVLLAGTIAGTLIGATFAFLTFAFLAPQLKWPSITAIVFAAFWIGSSFFNRLRV